MKAIPGFPGYYINLKGQVWSDKSNRLLLIGIHTQGYKQCWPYTKPGKQKTSSIGSLLLTTFVRLPEPGELCRHLNDINTDDRLDNLAWGTQKDNMDDMSRNGHNLIGENHKGSKLFPLDILNILHLCKQKKYTNMKISKMYNVDPTTITDINKRRSWDHIHKVIRS